MKQLTWGVYPFRGQPVHNSHVWNIEKALSECDRVLLVLGSANKVGTERNPFPIDLRMEMVKEALKNKDDFDRLMFMELDDWSTEDDEDENKIWGHYLYYNIVSRIRTKRFKMYYTDKKEIIESWFDDEVAKYIEIIVTDRENIYNNLSATKIRQALLEETEEGEQYLKDNLPSNVYKMVPILRDTIRKVHENPLEDFSMQ